MSEDDVAQNYGALSEATRLTRTAPGRLEALRTQELILAVCASACPAGHAGFVAGHWHIGDEVGPAGFSDVRVYGVEGPAWPALDTVSAEAFAARPGRGPAVPELVERTLA